MQGLRPGKRPMLYVVAVDDTSVPTDVTRWV
jgi:hypothetical protein